MTLPYKLPTLEIRNVTRQEISPAENLNLTISNVLPIFEIRNDTTVPVMSYPPAMLPSTVVTHYIIFRLPSTNDGPNIGSTVFGGKKNNSTTAFNTSGNASNNSLAEYSPAKSIVLCDLPGFCQGSAIDIYLQCFNTTLFNCQACGVTRASIFLFLVICLGLAILIGNLLTIIVGCNRHKRRTATKMDICRSSLAAGDLMAGIQILVITVYSFAWSMNLSTRELNQRSLALRGSPQAFAAGIWCIFRLTVSLYHLVYMGMMRLFAITKPLRYRWQSKQTTYIGIAIVWLLSTLSSTIPAWFPNQYAFTYQPSSFLFAVTTANIGQMTDPRPAIATLIFFLVIPYLLMTISTLAAGICLFRYSKKQSRKLSEQKSGQSRNNKKQKSTLIVVAIMQMGFTVTLVPLAVVFGLQFSPNMNCLRQGQLSKAYLPCYYLCMSNSLLNVIIYNIRDTKFRREMIGLFKPSLQQSSVFTVGTSHRQTKFSAESNH